MINEVTGFLFFVLVALFGFLFFLVGMSYSKSVFRNELIKSGHAEYYFDETYRRQFRLKECK